LFTLIQQHWDLKLTQTLCMSSSHCQYKVPEDMLVDGWNNLQKEVTKITLGALQKQGIWYRLWWW
jgi:muconolactone delta-isomerase